MPVEYRRGDPPSHPLSPVGKAMLSAFENADAPPGTRCVVLLTQVKGGTEEAPVTDTLTMAQGYPDVTAPATLMLLRDLVAHGRHLAGTSGWVFAGEITLPGPPSAGSVN